MAVQFNVTFNVFEGWRFLEQKRRAYVVPKNLGKKTEHLFHFDLSISTSQSCVEGSVIVIRDDAGLVAGRKTFGMLFGVGV